MSDEFPVPAPAPVPEPAPVPVPAPAPTELTPPENAEPPKPAEPPKDEEGTLPKGVQRRIDRAVRQRYEAEARAKMAEEELNRYRAMQQPQSRVPAAEEVPTIDKFSNIEDYVTAKAQWVAREQIREALEANEQRSRQTRAQEEAEKLSSTWQERVTKAVAEIPDFEDVIGASQVPMSPAMERALVESEVGPKLAYWLAQNPEEATKIAGLPPTRAFAALGRIEERLQSAPPPPPPKPSAAPAPIEPVGSRAAVTKDPDAMTTEEWMAWRHKQLKSR